MTDKTTRFVSTATTQEADEADLIAEAKKNPAAFENLYARHVQSLFRYLCSKLGSVSDAEEVTSQTFLAALEGFDRYRYNGHFAAWLFSIARHKAADHFRRVCRQASLEDAEFIPQNSDLLQHVIQTERAAFLSLMIQDLPEKEHELLRLRFVAELTYAEIGRVLGRSEGAVKKAIYRLLARLQSQMEVSHD